MWVQGAIKIYGSVVKYEAKVYETKSQYGIDGGRISKLLLKQNGKTVASYDREWDQEPTTPEAQIALEILAEEYKEEETEL